MVVTEFWIIGVIASTAASVATCVGVSALVTTLRAARAVATLILVLVLILILRILNLAAGAGNSLHLLAVAVVAGLGAQTESHGAQSWQCYTVTFGGPRLDCLTSSIPTCLHDTFTYSAAKGSLLDYLFLTE